MWTALLLTLITGHDFHNIFVDGRNKNVCKTKACKITAQRILEYMDPKINPCEDFYEFACGNFVRTAEIKPHKEENSGYTYLEDGLRDALNNILTEEPKDNEPHYISSVKEVFHLCLDVDKINKDRVFPAMELLRKAGGWPILEKNWSDNEWNFVDQELLLNRQVHGVGYIVRVQPGVDHLDPSRYAVFIGQPTLGVDILYLQKGPEDPIVKAYSEFMIDLAVLFGANKNTAAAEFSRCLQFEIALAQISYNAEDERNVSLSVKYTIDELEASNMNWMDWIILLTFILPDEVQTVPTEVIITHPQYFVDLKDVIARFSKKTIANWMMWRAASEIIEALSEDARHLMLKFIHTTSGVTSSISRLDKCIEDITSYFTIALKSMYVKKYFHRDDKKAASELADSIKVNMVVIMSQSSWMDSLTSRRAVEKLMALEFVMGYPNELLKKEKLARYYKQLTLNTTNYLSAWVSVRKFSALEVWNYLDQRVIRRDWIKNAKVFEVNAVYDAIDNGVDVPAPVLQLPFFNPRRPAYLNYGVLGTVVGHEITHAFDDQGSEFDKNGEFVNWWEESSKEDFKKQVQCVIDEYNSYKMNVDGTELNLNGARTVGENIADIGGMKIAYKTYKHYYPKEEPSLPGLERYSLDQMFLISTANFFCTKMRPQALRQQFATHNHPPSKLRINGMIMHFEQFGDIFKCKPGTPMNPTKKCTVW